MKKKNNKKSQKNTRMGRNIYGQRCQFIKGHCHIQMMPQTAKMAMVGLYRFIAHTFRHLCIHEPRKDFLNSPTFLRHLQSLFCHVLDPLPSLKIEV